MIGSVFSISSFSGVSTSAGADGGRLFDNADAALQALDNSRNGVDHIKAVLIQLRDALSNARNAAGDVPGRTVLKPVIADVERTGDKPTFVDINGVPVQSGVITVSLGTRPLTVGYERANRSALDVGPSLRSLASQVASLVANAGAANTNGFVNDVSTLLKSSDLIRAVNTPDSGAIDAAVTQIDNVLAKASGLGSYLGAQAAAAALVDLGGLLLGASSNADTGAPAGAYQTTTGTTTGTQLSSFA